MTFVKIVRITAKLKKKAEDELGSPAVDEEKKTKVKDAKVLDKEKERSLNLLEGIPKEQRELLEAAIKSGELDPEALKPALK